MVTDRQRLTPSLTIDVQIKKLLNGIEEVELGCKPLGNISLINTNITFIFWKCIQFCKGDFPSKMVTTIDYIGKLSNSNFD